MTPDDIRDALETAVEVPEAVLHAAVANAAELAPAVIAVVQSMADGRLPLPREERLLRIGLHVLSVARETSICPAFLALLRRPQLELEWLFGEFTREARVARLLLGLFDGDDAALRAIAADPNVDAHMRGAMLEALARLVWEKRASRDALIDLLDRFDREELAAPDSWAWFGWHTAIMLLGLTDWVERVQRAHDAGRELAMFDREVDRQDWLQRIQTASDHPEGPQLFIDDGLIPYDDPVDDLEWLPDPAGGPDDPLSEDEFAWLDMALWRRMTTETMCLEWADGYLSAVAAGPERVARSDYLPAILGTNAEFDTPEHTAYVAELLVRHLASIEGGLADDGDIDPFVNRGVGDMEGSLWAEGYLACVQHHEKAWVPLFSKRYLAERLIAPLVALIHDYDDEPQAARLTDMERSDMIGTLPLLISGTWSFWRGKSHPLLEVPRERGAKVGRNDPCPCGSGKKYKRCCGAVA